MIVDFQAIAKRQNYNKCRKLALFDTKVSFSIESTTNLEILIAIISFV